MTVSFQKERFEPVWRDAQALFRDHWNEIAEMKDVNRLDPDVDEYKKLERVGYLHVMTARDDGRLVGYYACFVKRNLHYRSVVVGSDDLYFVHPAYRGTGVGVRLFLAAEQMQRDANAVLAVLKDKVAHSHEALFAKLGYEKMENVYWKKLAPQPVMAQAFAAEGAC